MIQRPERNLGLFFSQHLVLEYLQDRLDPERQKAFVRQLEVDQELRKQCEEIEVAQRELRWLGQTKVSDELVEHFLKSQSTWSLFLDLIRFDRWPIGLKWSLESLGVLSLVLIVAMVIPWGQLARLTLSNNSTLVISEYNRKPLHEKSEEYEKEEHSPSVTYPDETGPEPTVVASKSNDDKLKVSDTAKVASQETASKATSAKTPADKSPTQTAATVAAIQDKSGMDSGNSAKQGFLFRGQIHVTNVKAVSPKFADKIIELGGRKAGDVPLGWGKGTGSYFHFTIPESRYEALVAFMREYGDLKIQREKHERVMPQGIMRLIVQMEEKK